MPDSGFVMPPTGRVVDASIAAVNGGSLEFFVAGTSTPKLVYSDSTLSTSLGSVVYLDSGGHPVSAQGGSTKVIIYTGNALIKIVAKDSAGVVLATYDNVKCTETAASSSSGTASVVDIVSKTSDYTVLTTDNGKWLNCDATGGTFTITLPSASAADTAASPNKFTIGIRTSLFTTNDVKIKTVSGQAISLDGIAVTSMVLGNGSEAVQLASNGSGWYVLHHSLPGIVAQNPIQVVDRLAIPPTAPNAGDFYILTGTPSGAWDGYVAGHVVRSDGQGGWHRWIPPTDCGWLAYVMDENVLTQFRDSAWVDLTGVVASAASALGHITVAYQLADGTTGGIIGAANNTWYTRLLNTTVKAGTGTLSGASLSSNTLTGVPAGTYFWTASLKFGKVNGGQFRIRGTTAGIIDYSSSPTITTTDEQNQVTTASGVFTLAAADTIYIENASSVNANDVGACGAASAITGVVETFASFTLIDLSATPGPTGAQGPQGSVAATPYGALTLANGVNSNVVVGDYQMMRITGPSGAFSISGFVAPSTAKLLFIYNPTAQTMTLTNDATSTAANRIYTMTGADVALVGPSMATLIYDTTDARWILTATQG